MIGNIFVQSWVIWATFHTASDHQKFPLVGYDLKNVLTILRNFAEHWVQEMKNSAAEEREGSSSAVNREKGREK